MTKRIVAFAISLLLLVGLCSTAFAMTPLTRDDVVRIQRKLDAKAILTFGKLRKDGLYYSTRYKTQGGDMLIDICFKNTSEDQTVDAIDVAIYCTNAYDEELCPDDDKSGTIRYFTANQKIKPGKEAYIGYCRMAGCSSASGYHIALVRYHTTDGETFDFGSSLKKDPMERYDWWSWTQLD